MNAAIGVVDRCANVCCPQHPTSAWGGFMRSAQMLAEHGKFDGFADAASGKALNRLFKDTRV